MNEKKYQDKLFGKWMMTHLFILIPQIKKICCLFFTDTGIKIALCTLFDKGNCDFSWASFV